MSGGALCEMLDFPASPCRHRHVRTAALRCPAAKRRQNVHVQPGHSVSCGWTNYQVSPAPNGRKKISPTRERSVVPEASVSRLLQTWGFSLAQSVASLHATRYAVASPPSRHTDQRLPYSSRFRRAGIDADGIKFHPALEGALFAVRSPPRSARFAAMIPTVES
jgi:hypothetical protein